MRRLLLALALTACAGGVQKATVVPTATMPAPEANAETWELVPESSRFDVVGVDITGTHHPVTFDRWRGMITHGKTTLVDVEIDMTSARGESEYVTRLLKYDLLDVDHHPTAKLVATIRPVGNAGDQIVSGNATIRGVTRGLRFHGTLRREGPWFRFVARFRISRDVFGIHADASWDGLIRDDVHIVIDARARPLRR